MGVASKSKMVEIQKMKQVWRSSQGCSFQLAAGQRGPKQNTPTFWAPLKEEAYEFTQKLGITSSKANDSWLHFKD